MNDCMRTQQQRLWHKTNVHVYKWQWGICHLYEVHKWRFRSMSEEPALIPLMSAHIIIVFTKMTTGYDYTVLCPLTSELTFNVHEFSWALVLINYVYSTIVRAVIHCAHTVWLHIGAHSDCVLQRCENRTFNHYWQDIKCIVVYLTSTLANEKTSC